jgi:hypothetical protein
VLGSWSRSPAQRSRSPAQQSGFRWTAADAAGGAPPGAAVVVAAEAVFAELVAFADSVVSLAQLDPEISTYELNVNVESQRLCRDASV